MWQPAGPASRIRPWWDRTLVPMHAAGWPVRSVPLPSTRGRHRTALSTRVGPSSTRRGQSWHRRLRTELQKESSPRDGVEPGHTISIEVRSMSVHAVEFSKTAAPPREDCPLRSAPRPDRPILGQTAEYSARIRRRRLDFDLEAGPAPGGCSAADQHRRSTSTVRSRGRSSKSSSTICCQVPSPRRPPITGIDTDGPITAARRCACALVS